MEPIGFALYYFLGLLELAILVRVLLSWVDPVPYPNNRFKEILYSITDPILEPLRQHVPPLGMFDISPIVAFVVLEVLREVVAVMFGI